MRSRRKGAGSVVLIVSSSPSAVATAVSGTDAPNHGEPLVVSTTQLMLFAAVWAVKVVPSSHVIPFLRVKFSEVPFSLHFSARYVPAARVLGSMANNESLV